MKYQTYTQAVVFLSFFPPIVSIFQSFFSVIGFSTRRSFFCVDQGFMVETFYIRFNLHKGEIRNGGSKERCKSNRLPSTG